MIKTFDLFRQALWALATEMRQAGLIPDEELMFFMKIDEIDSLLHGKRNPLILIKSKQRRRLYPVMDKYKFDEFVVGFEMLPRVSVFETIIHLNNVISIQNNKPKEDFQLNSDGVSLKGTPVTVGAIEARVCVAENIEEAVNIQVCDHLSMFCLFHYVVFHSKVISL